MLKQRYDSIFFCFSEVRFVFYNSLFILKNLNESSPSHSNLNSLNLQASEPAPASSNTEYSQMTSENLYDEYKRRLELIKKLKPVN